MTYLFILQSNCSLNEDATREETVPLVMVNPLASEEESERAPAVSMDEHEIVLERYTRFRARAAPMAMRVSTHGRTSACASAVLRRRSGPRAAVRQTPKQEQESNQCPLPQE